MIVSSSLSASFVTTKRLYLLPVSCRRGLLSRRRGTQLQQVLSIRRQQQQQFSTYYDSQSGLHVPIHNDNDISVFFDLSSSNNNTNDGDNDYYRELIPIHLYKEDAYSSSDTIDQIKSLQQFGVNGLILPPFQFPRDGRNFQTLCNICSGSPPTTSSFQLFSFSAPPVQMPTSNKNSNFSIVVEYDDDGTGDSSSEDIHQLEATLQEHVKNRLKTTILLGSKCYARSSEDPIVIANKVALIIDSTGGGDYLWISMDDYHDNDSTASAAETTIDNDTMLQLCEELMYLDVPGATIKSRLMVNNTNESEEEDFVDEIMLLGINKFVITKKDQIEIIKDVAQDQGKTVVCLSS